jgi:hypothetical protein
LKPLTGIFEKKNSSKNNNKYSIFMLFFLKFKTVN